MDVVENVFDVGNDHMLIIRHQICDYHWHACSSLSVLPTDVEDVVEKDFYRLNGLVMLAMT